jgi:hypothetical protein
VDLFKKRSSRVSDAQLVIHRYAMSFVVFVKTFAKSRGPKRMSTIRSVSSIDRRRVSTKKQTSLRRWRDEVLC